MTPQERLLLYGTVGEMGTAATDLPHLLAPQPHEAVLEIGTGLGYQTAILADLAGQVWSVEIIEEFARHAEALLQSLGSSNVGIRVGDGSRGWPEHAPFDKVLLTVAAKTTPPALLEKLKPGDAWFCLWDLKEYSC